MANKRQGGLGRGLNALIPSDPKSTAQTTPGETSGPFRSLDIEDVIPNTYQPRREFDVDKLQSLSDSIKELGVLQPILVRKHESGKFELIAGERRWRASKAAGLTKIPAVIRDIDNETSLAHAIVENVQRADLNPIEEAAAFQQLLDEFQLTQEEVATRVGRSRPVIANALRLLQLPSSIQKSIIVGELSAGHGRVLVAVEEPRRSELAKLVIREELSVRALEELARETPDQGAKGNADPSSIGDTKPAALLELESLIGDHFDTSVNISFGKGKGRISIDFADIDDLERIYGLMGVHNS